MDPFETHIIRKLYMRDCFGGKHTALENALSGLPRHDLKGAKQALHNLVNRGLIILKPTSYGLQVSLNPQKIQEIESFLPK